MKQNPRFINVFRTEAKEKIAKNWLQIIKYMLICFVPFLYGFICCWAFWNPLTKIGNIPMASVTNNKFYINGSVAYKRVLFNLFKNKKLFSFIKT
ncbi:hypothetical protein [Spiroplasma endosymbiont of Seladonia tumulorum]|uniref:hypothetical protein n=1 Tax=Spiroplasma endosymbiont of Seladonia tumulorum TaxID=3066321 RepID=UPI0030CDAB7C